ncbi:MAG: helix-turn-helix domain-containing protein [Solirubrobacterales bacterium]
MSRQKQRKSPEKARSGGAAAPPTGAAAPATGAAAPAIEALAGAVESGAGLPAVARAAARVLDGSVVLIDRSSAVLAVADASPDQEERLLSGSEGVVCVELTVAAEVVGELRYRPRSEPDAAIARVVAALLGLELERARSPQWESEEAAAGFVRALLRREVTDRRDIVARAAELGADLEKGGAVAVLRAVPRAAQSGDWRARVMTVSSRSLRSAAPGSLAALEAGEGVEVAAVVPAGDEDRVARAAAALQAELTEELAGFHWVIGWSRRAADPVDLYRAGNEARLAVNVAEAEGRPRLAFEQTGAYRLLLGAMSEDPEELQRFYSETIEPLAAYDDQYETELVRTVETYLENDGNVAATAKELFTHRHTVRYRLERARELCGHDVSSTAGREKLGLGLKAMRVLGIPSLRGPAMEPGAEAGKVPRAGED